MQQQDKPAFLATINGLAAIKPGAKITPEALDMWWLALADWSIEDFKQAAAHLAKTSEFMPNPYHFEQLRKAGEETAGEAFAKVLAYVRGNQRGESPGGRIDRVVRAMGGYNVFGGDVSGTPFREKRFAELWAETGEVEKTREALPSVAAIPALRQLSDMKRVGRA